MGLVDRLGLSRSHATFAATVTVHELLQVPLVNAKFRVKWKFKGSTSSHQGGDGEDSSSVKSGRGGGMMGGGNRPHHPLGGLNPRPRDIVDTAKDSTAEESSGSSRHSKDYGSLGIRSRSPPQSPYLDTATPNPNRTPNANYGFSQAPLSTPSTPHFSSIDTPDGTFTARMASDLEAGGAAALSNSLPNSNSSPYRSLSRDSDPATRPRESSSTSRTHHHVRVDSRGVSPLVPLRAHTATFNTELHCTVTIPLRSSTGAQRTLQPSPLRLTIRQESMGDAGKKEEIKAGEVSLDLSQFVGNGEGASGSPRRYLLKDCKTNATLRVTVTMEWVGGESDYIAPPLRSGQVQQSTSSTPILSTPSLNRSSTSLSSFRKASAASSTRESLSKESSVGMTRTNSAASSIRSSVYSKSSLPSSNPPKPRGWHPASSAFSSSGSVLGTAGTERNAYDVIDNLFNQPQWATEAPRNATIVNPVPGGRNGQSPAKGKEKEKEKEGWFKIGGGKAKFSANALLPSPTRTAFHDQTPRPLSVITVPTPPPQIVARPSLQPPSRRQNSFPLLSRRTSTASSMHSGKAKSIRWDDDDTVSVGLKAFLPPSRISSSTSLNRLKDDAEAEQRDSEVGRQTILLDPISRGPRVVDKGVKFISFGAERRLTTLAHS